MVEQVVVFLDWQNVYMRARESFHDEQTPSTVKGQVHPLDLGLTLAERGAEGAQRELKEVRIYRGMPDQKFDEVGYAAARRQIAAWRINNKIKVFPRVLRYPEGWVSGETSETPREKGVDVALAVDLVTCALEGLYDTAVVMSSDQDLAPAVEYVQRIHSRGEGVRVEVAAWKSIYGRRANRITAPGVFCHWLDQQDYWGLMDETDYKVPPDERAEDGRPRPHPPRF